MPMASARIVRNGNADSTPMSSERSVDSVGGGTLLLGCNAPKHGTNTSGNKNKNNINDNNNNFSADNDNTSVTLPIIFRLSPAILCL